MASIGTLSASEGLWQLLNKIDDPKLSTLRKFAAAMGVPMSEFFPAEKKEPAEVSSVHEGWII